MWTHLCPPPRDLLVADFCYVEHTSRSRSFLRALAGLPLRHSLPQGSRNTDHPWGAALRRIAAAACSSRSRLLLRCLVLSRSLLTCASPSDGAHAVRGIMKPHIKITPHTESKAAIITCHWRRDRRRTERRIAGASSTCRPRHPGREVWPLYRRSCILTRLHIRGVWFMIRQQRNTSNYSIQTGIPVAASCAHRSHDRALDAIGSPSREGLYIGAPACHAVGSARLLRL